MHVRLAKASIEVKAIMPDAQAPLVQLAERCRVGLDADVVQMRQSTAASGNLSTGGRWTSIWAAPLGAVLQVSSLQGQAPLSQHALAQHDNHCSAPDLAAVKEPPQIRVSRLLNESSDNHLSAALYACLCSDAGVL
jgi:hypothetical protein